MIYDTLCQRCRANYDSCNGDACPKCGYGAEKVPMTQQPIIQPAPIPMLAVGIEQGYKQALADLKAKIEGLGRWCPDTTLANKLMDGGRYLDRADVLALFEVEG